MAEHVVGARRLLDPPGVELARPRIAAIASSTPQTWFASIISDAVGAERVADQAGAAVVRLEVAADLHLHVREAVCERLPHERLDLVVVVAEPAGRRRVGRVARGDELAPRALLPARRARAAGRAPRPGGGRRRCSGSRRSRRAPPATGRASSCQSGLPSRFAQRSQTALTTAAVARWMTPFSGPSQRSCLSETSERQKPRMSAVMPSSVRPTTSGSSARTAATQTSVPRPLVKVRPWPSRPSSASVRRTTYAAE